MASRLPFVVALACLATSAFAVKFKLVNNCKFTVWPGILGPEPIPEQGGLELKAGASKDIEVPNGWRSNRIWPRTGCDDKMNCETGSCGPKLKCAGAGGEPPVSLAEFTLASNSNEKDFYDVSYVDGYNVEMTVEPIEGTFKKEGGDKYSCTQAGKCTGGDPLKQAPEELKQKKDGKVVAVYTACTKERLDSYCCAGAHNVPAKCDPKKDWPKDLYSPLKKLCPTGYWYAYDDATSTFTCKGSKNPSPDYKITFCGESSSQSPSPDATTQASATTPKEVESGPCTETCSNGGHTPTCCQAHNFKTGSCRDGKAFCVPKE